MYMYILISEHTKTYTKRYALTYLYYKHDTYFKIPLPHTYHMYLYTYSYILYMCTDTRLRVISLRR